MAYGAEVQVRPGSATLPQPGVCGEAKSLIGLGILGSPGRLFRLAAVF